VTNVAQGCQLGSTIEQQVKEVLAGNLGKPVSAINLEDDLLLDLGLDSLSLAELTVRVEELAGERFAGEDLIDTNTVGDLVRLVSRKREAHAH
jgi:acyl carrier protein